MRRTGKHDDATIAVRAAGHVNGPAVFANDAGMAQSHSLGFANRFAGRAGCRTRAMPVPPGAAIVTVPAGAAVTPIVVHAEGRSVLAEAEIDTVRMGGRHCCKRAEPDDGGEGCGLEFAEHGGLLLVSI